MDSWKTNNWLVPVWPIVTLVSVPVSVGTPPTPPVPPVLPDEGLPFLPPPATITNPVPADIIESPPLLPDIVPRAPDPPPPISS